MRLESAVLAAFVGVFLSVPPLGASTPEASTAPRESIPGLEEIRRHLEAGRWDEARAAATSLADDLALRLAAGRGDMKRVVEALAHRPLAEALAYRALAETASGRRDDAAWSWFSAQEIYPAIADPTLDGLDLQSHGPPGRALAELTSPCRKGDWETCSAVPMWRSAAGLLPPRKQSGDLPRLPRAIVDSGGDRVVLQIVIGTDGRPRDPVVVAARHHVSSFLALEALSGWRFEPARRGGEPIAVVVEQTIHFAPEASNERVGSWRRRLKEMEDQLRRGEWEAAAATAEALVEELAAEVDPGGSDLLAKALSALALADAGRGRTEEAIWNWQVAQNLAFELRWMELSAYGGAGQLLSAHRLRQPGEVAAGTPVSEADKGEFGSLRRTAGADPVYPELVAGQVPVVEVVLRDGRPEAPLVLSAHPPAVVLAALRALRTWRLAPDGDPLTVHTLALMAETDYDGVPASPVSRHLAERTKLALTSNDPVRAKCYWDQVSDPERNRLGPAFDWLRIQPRRIEDRWALSAPSVAESEGETGRRGDVTKEIGGEVQAPVKIHAPPPRYTDRARDAGIEGTMTLQMVVDRDGNVNDLQVLEGLAPEFDAEVAETVCGWKFRPATLENRPVDVYYELTINFTPPEAHRENPAT